MNKNIYLISAIISLLTTSSFFSQNVNPFNGSLEYDVPLLSVPSAAGNAVPINLIYGGNGINVEQPASEAGLGWSLSAGGSIVRSVSGIPDDFNGKMLDHQSKNFLLEKGTLFGPTGADVLTSRRNLDSLQFYFPNYDSYNVSGPGIGGSMTPMILNYLAFNNNTRGGFDYDADESRPWVAPQFVFNGDFSDTLVSRHFPNTTTLSTPFKMPKDIITGACYNDATAYYGKKGTGTGTDCSENYDPVTNRLGTSNYVEYTMDPLGINGIQSFTITNSAGFVYKYTLPVYTNYSVNYTYPLANDYSILTYTNVFTPDVRIYDVTGTEYYIEHQTSSGAKYIIETNSAHKFAKEWKLTSVTGPDYVDVNHNNVIDEDDNGYWVIFDYKLWTNSLTTRYPAYGFNYYFGSDAKTENYAVSDPYKISGKFGVASLINEEVYYLNSIKTSTHKALFVRDVRQDEVGSNPGYDSGLHNHIKINQTGSSVSSWHGNMFDEGGSGSYISTSPATNYTKTIQLEKVDKIILNFKELDMAKTLISGNWVYDELFIYAGPNDTYPPVSFTYGSVTYTSPFTTNIPGINIDVILNNYSQTAITFKIVKHGLSSSPTTAQGFNIEWHASGKRTPQLYIKRVLLFDNKSITNSSFPAVSSITGVNSKFDLTPTTNNTQPLYNETWYQANKTYLNAVTLKGSELVCDYSLANKYYKNISCEDYYKNTRLSSPNQVLQNISVNPVTGGTGKLTLNKIIATEKAGTQVLPSTKFDYNITNVTDNPDYNPVKVDNWGFYKHDASSLGYYGYVTQNSKNYTDAWSLRKITSPYGGVTEIEYEANSYTKVSDGNGDYRPISRIFPIAALSTNPAVPLDIHLEEGSNLNADLSEVYNATSNIPADIFLPLNLYPSTHGPVTGVGLANFFGTLSFSYNVTTPLPLRVTHIPDSSNATIDKPVFKTCTSIAAGTFSSGYNIIAANNYEYSGSGWVRFKLPDGNIAYGGGNRVKKIISHNGLTDAYTMLYEYYDGVALNEADRFIYPKYRHKNGMLCAMPGKLENFGSDKFEQGPVIGYKKVIIKNLGQINSDKGRVEMTFNTRGSLDDDASVISLPYNTDNFAVTISRKSGFTHTLGTMPCTQNDSGFVVEYIDKFSPFWGLMKEQKQFDANGNMLSRNTMVYEPTEQGAIVENFAFYVGGVLDPHNTPCPGRTQAYSYIYQTCIKRHYPAVLKRSVSYGMGTRTISETLSRDEITGEATIAQVVSDNRTSVLSIKKPAFRIQEYETMGPKSVNPSWSNILGADAYSYSSVDTTLTVAAGQPGTNFSNAGANVFTKTVLVRSYDPISNTYSNNNTTLPNWYNQQSFSWIGSQGSLDTFGLYKRSELASNPFNFNDPLSSGNKWRSTGKINLMDTKGHTLESISFNNKFSATKLDFTGKYLIAQISNCNYRSFTYSGFEYKSNNQITDGEVVIPASTCLIIDEIAHTGKYSVRVMPTDKQGSDSEGPSYTVNYEMNEKDNEEKGLMLDRIYRASVWMLREALPHSSSLNLSISGELSSGAPYYQLVSMSFDDLDAINIGGWQLLSVDLKVPAKMDKATLKAYMEVNGPYAAFFDDFQLHPVESTVTAKVYDSVTGRVTAEISADGFATKYVYDAAGNVIDTYKEIPGVGLKLIKHRTVNYARGND